MALPKHTRAVITGAGGGLGRALALEIVSRGGRVLIGDIDQEGAAETVRLVTARGGEAWFHRCDVSHPADVEALADEAERLMGGADLVINNAGVAVGGPVGEIPISDWEWIMGINLWGPIYGCHTFIPRFKKQKSGHILNVASAAGLVYMPMMGPYNVTKAGVVALSETLAAELASEGISVTVLCPTFFKTNIAASGRTHGSAGSDLSFVDKLMARASIQADGVAKVAIDAVDAGRVHALPHGDGRWAWRLKRAVPGFFAKTLLSQAERFGRGKRAH